MSSEFPLRELTTWKVGGCCSDFAEPTTTDAAVELLAARLKKGEPFYVLGGGSNVLVQDGLLRALVLHTRRLDRLAAADRADCVEVEVHSGLPVKRLLEFAIKNSLGGCEFLAGIPGTVGGALWGNAGAAGIGFSDIVLELETIEADGGLRIWSSSELDWRYRACPLDERKSVMIARALLRMPRVEPLEIREKIRCFAMLKKSQPIGGRTAGCIFKNPPMAGAGKLLDEAGCKGMRVGGAVVSNRHANFIENTGGAAARDIYELSEQCRVRVLDAFGIGLEYEIHFIGEF